MKTFISNLLKGRITRLGLLAALLIAIGATVGWTNQRQYQLGGGFIGTGPGTVWNAVQTPLDPNGRAAAFRVNLTSYGAATARLLAAFGADSLSDFIGEQQMISRDTAKYGSIAYANQQGNPPQLRAILVMNGTLKFAGPNNYTVDYTIDVYPAAADADLDGYPDAGAVPVVTIPGLDTAKRVPIP